MVHPSPIKPSPARQRRSAASLQRAYVRPFDDETTERVRVIAFVWTASRGIQPVLMLERELLN